MSASALASTRIGVVGTGVMAEAMVAGLLRQRLVDPALVTCSHPRAERREELRATHGVAVCESNREAARGAGLVLLAVKPQLLPRVLPQLRGALEPDSIVLSVIAGAGTAALRQGLAHEAVVRTMPNTPARIGEGVTVWFATDAVDDAGRELARATLAALGRQFEVHDERQVAMATAVSGTGPTYIFLFIEALTDAAVHLGFPRQVARELVLDTMSGSAAFALQSGRHVAELRDMVTSPGGTSAEALYQLERGRLRTVVSDAVWAAFERTLALEAALDAPGGVGTGPPPGRPSRR